MIFLLFYISYNIFYIESKLNLKKSYYNAMITKYYNVILIVIIFNHFL